MDATSDVSQDASLSGAVRATPGYRAQCSERKANLLSTAISGEGVVKQQMCESGMVVNHLLLLLVSLVEIACVAV